MYLHTCVSVRVYSMFADRRTERKTGWKTVEKRVGNGDGAEGEGLCAMYESFELSVAKVQSVTRAKNRQRPTRTGKAMRVEKRRCRQERRLGQGCLVQGSTKVAGEAQVAQPQLK